MSESLDLEPISLSRDEPRSRTFLLGNEGGFVLYLPVTQNVPDRALHAIKWFGASGFGRTYLEDNVVWLVHGDTRAKLDCHCQTGFAQYVDRAVRTFDVDGCAVHQTFFVPDQIDAFVMRLEADCDAEFEIEPQLDMRYYQIFDHTLDGYQAKILQHGNRSVLRVTNRITCPTPTLPHMDFFCLIGVEQGEASIDLIPEAERARPKVYLKDEARARLIERVYGEAQGDWPDEAPIWDRYETTAYAPARLRGRSPLTIAHAFGDQPGETHTGFAKVSGDLPRLQEIKRLTTLDRIGQGKFHTGQEDMDRAYTHVLTRFNDCLVARDVTVHGETGEQHHFNAILAGNKYFLDAWKRDENISLIGLLTTGDLETVRAILKDTWSYQDRRTGRLPHIIRLGEPLVYYSSDGTLWALERLHRYGRMSGDLSLLEEKYPMVEHFFNASLRFVQRGLLPSGGIIDKKYLWETWMDTPYTPRDGYPVEIELLWLTALSRYLPVIRSRNGPLADRLQETLEEGLATFRLFTMDGFLADSLSYEWEPRDLLTPNGYIAFGLAFPLPDELARSMVALGQEQLAGRVGIRGLAPRDWPKVFTPEFLHDPENFRDGNMVSVGLYNYHRGIEWLWLNQFFVAAELLHGDADAAYELYIRGQVHAALCESGVGGLGELYDAHGPLGADFQAWSMTGFVASLHQLMGADVDAIERRVRVRPSPPSGWDRLATRCRLGSTYLDLDFREEGGRRELEIRPTGTIPGGYTLCAEIPLRAGAGTPRVTFNGTSVPEDRFSITARNSINSLYIETQLSGPTVIAVNQAKSD